MAYLVHVKKGVIGFVFLKHTQITFTFLQPIIPICLPSSNATHIASTTKILRLNVVLPFPHAGTHA